MDPKSIAENHLWPAYKNFVRVSDPQFPSQSWESIVLIGPGSKIDSLRFVQYLIEIEGRLSAPNRFGKDLSTPDPFRTMGAFARHIQTVLERDPAS